MNLRIKYEAVLAGNLVEGDEVVSETDKTGFIAGLRRQGYSDIKVSWCQPTTRPVGDVLEPGRKGRATMANEKDPRTDKSTDGPKQPAPQGTPHSAPGGAGTGTKNDPAREPAAQPDAGSSRR